MPARLGVVPAVADFQPNRPGVVMHYARSAGLEVSNHRHYARSGGLEISIRRHYARSGGLEISNRRHYA